MKLVFWTPAEAAARPMRFGPWVNVLDVRGVRPGSVGVPAACGMLLVGSEAARGAWAMVAGSVPVSVMPPETERVPAGRRITRVHVCVSEGAEEEAEAAVAWARAAGLACGIEGAEGAASLRLLERLGAAPEVAAGSVVLDLRPALERLEPCALAAAWVPVVLSAAALRALTPARYRALAGGEAGSLEAAVVAARGRVPHVLVISDEAPNLIDIRVHGPFGAMVRAGAIAGYTVLRRGKIGFSTAPVSEGLRFGAVWVQRSGDPATLLLLQTLRTGFTYDLDDLLLVSPSYRPAFSAESLATVRAMLGAASAISCATETLALRLAAHGVAGAIGRAVVTPNLAFGAPARVPGAARSVVWASSDRPALAGSRAAVEQAVRDFCRAHRLTLVCLGETAPSVFRRAGIAVEAAGLLPYPAYLDRLRAAAPGILVGPLETAADAATQEFVDCKSDIKLIEARLSGLIGVFSRAAPYVGSDLGADVLCENDYDGWLAGLERGRALCTRPPPARAWPEWRDATGGLAAWAAAVRAGAAELSWGEVREALGWVRAQASVPIPGPERFDEADYLRRHADVAAAVRDGAVPSAYGHYVGFGFREGRAARRLPSPDEAGSVWFARLLHETGRLERLVAARVGAVASLRARAVPAEPAAEADGVEWEPGGTVALPCPVCDAAGPHPVLLRREGQVLARCGRCGTCAAAERVVHEYGSDPQAGLLMQLYLEQNAGIHQQTGLLFTSAAEGSLLDVGCGFGFAVDLARRQLGWRAVGVDPSFLARAGREALGADIRVATLTPRMALGGRFAVVTASEVLEHVPEPYAFLRLLRARVAAGGALVLTTPDAGALRPGIGAARTLAITAPLVHLVLFTAGSLSWALQRVGFAEVQVSTVGDGLIAVASDRPIVRPADADARHVAAYRGYLEALMGHAEAGSALWNGAAGRLLALLEPSAAAEVLEALVGRIGAAWRERFGIELAGLSLPEPVAGEDAAALAARQPLNLGPVLLRVASMARRAGQAPEAVLALAGAAYRIALHAERTLQAANMIDHDLRQTVAQARAMMLAVLEAQA